MVQDCSITEEYSMLCERSTAWASGLTEGWENAQPGLLAMAGVIFVGLLGFVVFFVGLYLLIKFLQGRRNPPRNMT